jgi:hypothetical protein
MQVLSSSEGNILDDATAVATITEAKATANDIAEKQALAAGTKRDIDAARVQYAPFPCTRSLTCLCHADKLDTYIICLSLNSIQHNRSLHRPQGTCPVHQLVLSLDSDI